MKPLVASFFLAALACFGQPQPPGFTCVANTTITPTARVEGLTELVGDVLLQCTGGTPTAPGKPVPLSNITLSFNTQVTSRFLGNGFIDALLLIDEPGTGTNPSTSLLSCPNPAPASPAIVPAACAGFMNGIVGKTGGIVYGKDAPNVYLASSPSANAVTWLGVPIDAPSSSGLRVVRVTNVRANATQLGLASTLIPTPIIASVSINGAQSVIVSNPQQTVAFIQPGLIVGGTTGNFQQCPSMNGGKMFDPLGGQQNPATFKLNFAEGFVNSFKRRGVVTDQSHPSAVGVQAIPGAHPPWVESGLVPPAAAGLPVATGAMDSGSLIQFFLPHIPGLQVQVPALTPITDASGSELLGYVRTLGTGTVTGSNIAFQPGPDGSVTWYEEVVDTLDATTVIKNVNLPVTLFGGLPVVPASLPISVQFAASQFPQTNLFTAGSPLLNLFPIWSPTDTGAVIPVNPYDVGASVAPCNPTTGTLMHFEQNSPAFKGGSPVVPYSYNIGIVSPGQPVSKVTVAKDPTATWFNVSLNQATTPVTAKVTINPVTAAGHYTSTLTFSSLNSPNTVAVPVTYDVVPGPWFTRFGFTNAGSYVNNVVAPGEPFVLFGGEFGPDQLAGLALGADGRAVNMLANTQVLFDGQAVPLIYSAKGQVSGFAPFSLDGKTVTQVQVVYNGASSLPVSLFVLDAVPALFTSNQSGGGQAAVLNQDGSGNSSANPESVGNIVVLFGSGAGQTNPAGRDGALAGVGAPLAKLKLPVRIFIDNIEATDIPYVGPAPTLIEGIFQMNVRIPAGAHRNANVPVVVWVEDKQTQPGVTIATK